MAEINMGMSDYCPLCSNNTRDLGLPYKASSELFRRLKLAKCVNCDVVFSVPKLNPASLTSYNINYFKNAHSQVNLSKSESAYFSAVAFYRIRYVEKYIENSKIKNILEIGPGQGEFASRWINRNLTNKYCAVEADITCYENLRRIGVELFDMRKLTSNVKQPKFDLIVMSHVLEHIQDPLDYVKQLSSLLVKGGFIFIEVPCLDYLYKNSYEPHLFFYDKKSLINLLENAGFSIVSIDYFGETISEIIRPTILKYIMSIINKILARLPLNFMLLQGWGSNGLTVYQYIISKPFKASHRQEYPSRWIRLIAKLNNE